MRNFNFRQIFFCLAFSVFFIGQSSLVFANDTQEIGIGYLREVETGRVSISILDQPAEDLGFAGAVVGVNDNNTTGRFTGQKFNLKDVIVSPDDDVIELVAKLRDEGFRYFLLDLSTENTLKIADAGKTDVLLFNVGNLDDILRGEQCRANMIHTAPTRSMLTDGLAQYLVWKRWRNWLLVEGSHPNDKLLAEALKRAAKRFGAKIVAEKEYKDTGGARQSDSGHVQVQKQIPAFTQGVDDYDILIAADESEVFATYLPYRTWIPRPVGGSAGLKPLSWHPGFEGWGAAQIQNRFEKAIGRRMLGKDMQAWTAARMVGEAATRTKSNEVAKIEEFIKAPDFSIAAFKGQGLTLRDWNWQLRQPILLGDGKNIVSVSPQDGFLHQFSELDTMGVDRPESKCQL